MHAGESRGVSSTETLRAIAELAKTPESSARHPISVHELQGLGSDFDLQISIKKGKYPEARRAVFLGTRAREKLPPTNETLSLGMRRSVYLEIDVKPFEDVEDGGRGEPAKSQFLRSAQQGGAVQDLFVFDVSDGKLVVPDRFPTLAEDLVRGKAGYSGPLADDESIVENKHGTTIRGVRAMLELPWLRFATPDDEKRLRQELEALKKYVEDGGKLDPKTLEQIEKAWRNVAPSGANNRMYRAKKGSLDALVLETAEAIKKTHHVDVIPEFLPKLKMGRGVVDDLPKGSEHLAVPDELHGKLKRALPGGLVLPADFKTKYAPDGTLYHGTPTTSNALAILGGNLILSREGQGVAVFGRGGYFTPSEEIAMARIAQESGSDGVVVKLKLRDDREPVILDWEKFKETDEGKALLAHAGSVDKAFEILAERYGVDIILNTHVIVQNSDVFEYPKGRERFRFLIESYTSRAKNPAVDPASRAQAYETYLRILEYAKSHGEDFPSSIDHAKLVLEMSRIVMTDRNADRRKSAAAAVVHLASLGDPARAPATVLPLLRSKDQAVRETALEHLPRMPKDVLFRFLAHNGLINDLVREARTSSIGDRWLKAFNDAWTPEHWKELPTLLHGQSPLTVRRILQAAVGDGRSRPPKEAAEADLLARARAAAMLLEQEDEAHRRRGGQGRAKYPDWLLADAEWLVDPKREHPSSKRREMVEAARPLVGDHGLRAEEFEAASKHLGLVPRDLLRLDPVFAA